jgi:hypothetical protein
VPVRGVATRDRLASDTSHIDSSISFLFFVSPIDHKVFVRFSCKSIQIVIVISHHNIKIASGSNEYWVAMFLPDQALIDVGFLCIGLDIKWLVDTNPMS